MDWRVEGLLRSQTNNPYDLRSTGDSSGGEAALISSCCTAFGLGKDIGGSIRIPAFKCCIFGHNPKIRILTFAVNYHELEARNPPPETTNPNRIFCKIGVIQCHFIIILLAEPKGTFIIA
uniref:Amidase domain-containing protein n=1 Tax=Glossina palpalis gambiensis TaxID=67801 RepID=A0A1B0BH07_9MUSC